MRLVAWLCAAGLLVLPGLLEADPAPALAKVEDGGAWTASMDGDRALLLGRAVLIGQRLTHVRIETGLVVLDQGAALLIVGDQEITVESPTGPRLLRNEVVHLPLRAVPAEPAPQAAFALVPPSPQSRLAPWPVEAPLPYTKGQRSRATFEGVELEALEVEAGCVEICLE